MNTATTATSAISPSDTYHPAVTLIGRVLMAAIFLVFGVRKILAYGFYAGYFGKLGFPAPEVMVAVAIAIEVGGGALLVIGWKTRWVAWLLALFTLVATFAAHRYWDADAAQYANQMTHFFKNVCIIGGLMMVAAFGPGPISADKR